MPLTVVPSLFGYRGPACPLPTVRVPETRLSAADCSVPETRVRCRLFGTGDPCPLPTVRYRDPPVRCRLFGTGTRLSAADCSVPETHVRCRLFAGSIDVGGTARYF